MNLNIYEASGSHNFYFSCQELYFFGSILVKTHPITDTFVITVGAKFSQHSLRQKLQRESAKIGKFQGWEPRYRIIDVIYEKGKHDV